MIRILFQGTVVSSGTKGSCSRDMYPTLGSTVIEHMQSREGDNPIDGMRRLAQVFQDFHISEYCMCNPSKLHGVTVHASAGFQLLLHIVYGLVEYHPQSPQDPASQVLPPLSRAGSMHCRLS